MAYVDVIKLGWKGLMTYSTLQKSKFRLAYRAKSDRRDAEDLL